MTYFVAMHTGFLGKYVPEDKPHIRDGVRYAIPFASFEEADAAAKQFYSERYGHEPQFYCILRADMGETE